MARSYTIGASVNKVKRRSRLSPHETLIGRPMRVPVTAPPTLKQIHIHIMDATMINLFVAITKVVKVSICRRNGTLQMGEELWSMECGMLWWGCTHDLLRDICMMLRCLDLVLFYRGRFLSCLFLLIYLVRMCTRHTYLGQILFECRQSTLSPVCVRACVR